MQTHEDQLVLNAGDVLVMRGDCLHAGGEAAYGHFARIHCYMDSPDVIHALNETDRAEKEESIIPIYNRSVIVTRKQVSRSSSVTTDEIPVRRRRIS